MKAYCIHIKQPDLHEVDPDPFVCMNQKNMHELDVQITLDKEAAEELLADCAMGNPDCIYTLIEFELPA